MVTFDRLNELFFYDKENGRLLWKNDKWAGFKNSVHKCKAGEEAGCTRKDGRKVIRIDNKLYLAYRLIWFIENHSWPNGEIDHINGDSSDNRISNLRESTRKMNQENLRKHLSSKKNSDYLGVFLDSRKKYKKWRASITTGGKEFSLGMWNTPEEAYAAYLTAKRLLHKGCTI